jgi:hypothetical protein
MTRVKFFSFMGLLLAIAAFNWGIYPGEAESQSTSQGAITGAASGSPDAALSKPERMKGVPSVSSNAPVTRSRIKILPSKTEASGQANQGKITGKVPSQKRGHLSRRNQMMLEQAEWAKIRRQNILSGK